MFVNQVRPACELVKYVSFIPKEHIHFFAKASSSPETPRLKQLLHHFLIEQSNLVTSFMVTLLFNSVDLDPPILQALSDTKKVSDIFRDLSLIDQIPYKKS